MLEGPEVVNGMEVRFIDEYHLPYALEQARRVLEKDKKYLVNNVFKDRWGCYIYLAGIPNKSFNCAMFEDAGIWVPEEEEEKKPVKKVKAPKKKAE